MSLLEWFGENYFPGEFGSIEKRKRWTRDIPRYKVVINIIISVAMIAGLFIVVFKDAEAISLEAIFALLGVLIIYCVIAYFINPKPDYRNIGLGGTPINHPFKISDDINRLLAILKAMLWPGFYISRSILEFVSLLRHSGARDFR